MASRHFSSVQTKAEGSAPTTAFEPLRSRPFAPHEPSYDGAASGPKPRAPAESLQRPSSPSPVGYDFAKLPIFSGRRAEKPAGGAAPEADRLLGDALPGAVRARFERSLGADLGTIRVHSDAAAAGALDARAYTVGKDIYFGPGEYRPGTADGERLLAHEVIHTVQQAVAPAASGEAKLSISQQDDPAEREADALAGPLLSGEPVSVKARFPGGQQIMRTLRSSGIRVDPIEDVLTEANARVSINEFYPWFKDMKHLERVPVPKLRPRAKGTAVIQVTAYAKIAKWYRPSVRERWASYVPTLVRTIFGDLTELGTHTYEWPLEADQNGMLVKVLPGHVDSAQGHAAGLDVKFTAEVKDMKDNFSLLAAFSATSSSKVHEVTDPGTKSKTTFGVEGKVGVDKLKEKLPKPLQRLPLPSGDISGKFNQEINVEGKTTKDTETTAARNPFGSYQMNLQRDIPAAPAPAGGSGGPTNVTNIHQQTDIRVGDVNINPPAPEKPQPTTTTERSPPIQAGREGRAELPDAEWNKVHDFIKKVEIDLPEAWDNLHRPVGTRTGTPLIYVKGHASTTGTHERNKTVSRKRAKEVKRYLVESRAIREDCIEVEGVGAHDAKKTGPSAEERYVEITLRYRGRTYSY